MQARRVSADRKQLTIRVTYRERHRYAKPARRLHSTRKGDRRSQSSPAPFVLISTSSSPISHAGAAALACIVLGAVSDWATAAIASPGSDRRRAEQHEQ